MSAAIQKKYLYYLAKDKLHPYYTMAFTGIIFIVDIVITYSIAHKIFSAFSFAFNEKHIVSFYTFYDKLAMIISTITGQLGQIPSPVIEKPKH